LRGYSKIVTILQLINALKSGHLVDDPDFQRLYRWPDQFTQQFLMDLKSGEYMPAMLVWQTTDMAKLNGKMEGVLTNGKQRCTALTNYYDGKHTPQTLTPFKVLSRKEKDSFMKRKIKIDVMVTDDKEKAVERFKTLNRNLLSQSPQEDRHAEGGDFSDTAIKYAKKFGPFLLKNGIIQESHKEKMVDVELVSDLMLLATHDEPMGGKKDLDHYYAIYQSEYPEKKKTYEEIVKTFKMIQTIIPNLSKANMHTFKDFYSLFAALHKIRKGHVLPKKNHKALREEIIQVRKDVEEIGMIKQQETRSSEESCRN